LRAIHNLRKNCALKNVLREICENAKKITSLFTAMLANFAKPLTLSYLLVYMEGTVKDPATGFSYAGILIALSLFEGTLSVHLDYQLQRMKISLRSALVTAVYNKTILVARHRFEGKTIGEILNLMSTDCDRLANSVVNLHQLWCVPVQVALVLGLLYFQVGYVFGIGLGFSLVMIFVNHSIGKFIGQVNKQFMKAKDARIRLLSDIVYSISQGCKFSCSSAFSEGRSAQLFRKSSQLSSF
jgi:ABC-type bacteriocin/lantibiotic exporter with double-glycine peptidase domain